jgi:hypothetical protein
MPVLAILPRAGRGRTLAEGRVASKRSAFGEPPGPSLATMHELRCDPMRALTAPFAWLGRVALWVLFLPVGIWRSMRHHRKKGERRALAKFEKKYADKLKS